MSIVFRWLVAVSALMALGACAPFYKPLASEERARIKEADLRVVVAQETFMFTAQGSNVSAALGGGLIGALIDSSVQRSRQKDMASQIQATVGPLLEVDYRVEATAAVNALQQTTAFPLKLSSAQVLAGMPGRREHEARIAATGKSPSYLLMWVHYEIAADLSVFSTRSTVQLWQDGKPESTYRAGVVYQTRLTGGTREALMKRLTDNQGSRLRALMRESMQESLRMVAADLAAAPAASAARSGPLRSASVWTQGVWVPVKDMRLIDETPVRQFLRSDEGALLSIGTETES
ncbi:MAG: hypothetical protein ACT6SF_04890 [Hydrogenophaga sp.]|jgi:hypothetical protein|uniref:hypothetical protein n=1 Tax=Hydrogenophaga sp. TaxID=1904254 RepID=UPI001D2B5934|nr:hypothetical protein [Hydrogenophaga sp.]MBW0170060.1 hypothetical protein [Hydrogenophaga sp.]MBW0182468.1 hypothetical protein [Hydrogenophaga sp.]